MPVSSVLSLFALLCVSLFLVPACAHVTFSPNTGSSSTSLITAFRVPHGCDTITASGDDGPKVPTLALTAYIPTTLTTTANPLPGYVPNWPLTFNTSTAITDPLTGTPATTWTWTASDGVGLPLGQFLNFPVSMTLPAVAPGGSVVVRVAVVQQCAFGVMNLWGNTSVGALYPPPHITVTNVTASSVSSSAAPAVAGVSYLSLVFGLLLWCGSSVLFC